MRTHTTLTDIRRIMRLHTDGKDAKTISNEIYVEEREVSRVISVKFPKKKLKKKAAPTEAAPTEAAATE